MAVNLLGLSQNHAHTNHQSTCDCVDSTKCSGFLPHLLILLNSIWPFDHYGNSRVCVYAPITSQTVYCRLQPTCDEQIFLRFPLNILFITLNLWPWRPLPLGKVSYYLYPIYAPCHFVYFYLCPSSSPLSKTNPAYPSLLTIEM